MKKTDDQKTIWDVIDEQTMSQQQKCDSESRWLKCENCNCWKNKKDIYNEITLENNKG